MYGLLDVTWRDIDSELEGPGEHAMLLMSTANGVLQKGVCIMRVVMR